MRRLIAVPVAAVVLGASVADAGQSAPTSIGIAFDRASTSFGGRIRSPVAVCRATRRVSVYLQGGGRLGSAVSDAAGRWRLVPSHSFAVGDYYAITPAARRGADRCAAGRSLTTRAS